MAQLSEKMLQVKPSATLAITAKAKAMKAQGIDVVAFGAGQPDFDTPQEIKDAAIEAIQSGKTKYTPASGIPELKKAIIEKFQRDNGLSYNIENISVNCGAKHTLVNIFNAICNPGSEVIIPAPYWLTYSEQVHMAGGKAVIIPTSQDTDYKITPEILDKYMSDKTVAILLNSPSNPTGMVYSEAELQALADYLENKDVYIISDEVYEFLLYDGAVHKSIGTCSQKIFEKTLTVNAVSKTFAMTGWRIGYVGGPADVIKVINNMQSHATSNPCSIAQYAAVAALTKYYDMVKPMVEKYTVRRKLMLDLFAQIPEVEIVAPQGAFYVFPDFSKVIKRLGLKDSFELAQVLLDEIQIAVIPGDPFGAPGCIRFSYALSEADIKKGITRLIDFLKK